MDGLEFQQLVKTFQNVETLPQLPESAFRLVQACDAPDVSFHEVDHVVASDLGLTAMVLRSASSARYAGLGGPATTVSAAVMRLGIRNLKSLAMNYAFRTLLEQGRDSDWYDPRRLAGHSVFVAVAMQFLFEKEYGRRHYDLEEVFAFGLLHDLGICLLASVAPDQFDSTWRDAENQQICFAEAFYNRFEEPVATLSWAACTAWQLPDLHVEFLHALANPLEPNDLSIAVEALNQAERLSIALGYSLEPWEEQAGEAELPSEDLSAIEEAFQENWEGPIPFLHQAA